jgi:hypothetical protein
MGAWPSQPPRTTMASFDGAVGMRDTVSVLTLLDGDVERILL